MAFRCAPGQLFFQLIQSNYFLCLTIKSQVNISHWRKICILTVAGTNPFHLVTVSSYPLIAPFGLLIVADLALI